MENLKEQIIEILKRSSKEFWEKHWTNPEYEHNSYLADQILSLIAQEKTEVIREILEIVEEHNYANDESDREVACQSQAQIIIKQIEALKIAGEYK